MGEKRYIRVERHKWADEIEAEKKQTKRRFTIFLICLLCFLLGFGASAIVLSDVGNSGSSSQNKFNVIYDLMKNEWYFGKDVEDLDSFLIDNAIEGLTTNEYDIHTNYLDAEKAVSYLQKLEGSVVGIGITMTMIEEDAIITRVYANSPAQAAGLKQGDIIKKVDGISVKGKTIEEIASLTKGEKGTKVSYEVDRSGKTMNMEMSRASVNASAYGYMEEDVAVLQIDSFSENTDQEVAYYLSQFAKEKANKIIIDLRDNTGGYVNAAINICSLFVGKGKPVFFENTRNGDIKEFRTVKSDVYTFDKMVLLVNENTASASEVMATCLKAHLDVTLVGTNTYGKGTVQVSKQFKDGSYIKYTIAEWLTAEKNQIHKIGVKPDVVSSLHPVLSKALKEDKTSYHVDSVSELIKTTQLCLDFLGYDVDRTDGYFSTATLQALHKFQQDYKLEVTNSIDMNITETMFNKVSYKWILEKDVYDTQYLKAIEVVNGR